MVEAVKVLHSKKETVYGTDAAPTALANAALTRNFQGKPIATDRLARNLDRPVRGGAKDAATNARQTLSYELELAGSGAAGTAAPWMEHLEACGMAAPTLTAGATAVQKFAAIGVTLSAMTHYHWRGNQRRRTVGARGTYGFDFTAGSYPFLRLDMTGLLLPASPLPDENTPATPDLARWIEPVEVNTANTDFVLGGYSPVLKSFTGDVNAEVAVRNLVGSNSVKRGNHGITGRLVIEAPSLAAKNYYTQLLNGDEIPVQLIHGIVAGNIVQLDGAHLQITDIDDADEVDTLMMSMAFRMNVGTTNDDLIWTAK